MNNQKLVKKPSIEVYKLAEKVVIEKIAGEESNYSLKESWIDLGSQLEIEGFVKDQICTIASKLIIEKKSEKTKIPKEEIKLSGYFYRIYHDQGWTNSFYARNTNEKELVPLGEQEDSSTKPNQYESENDSHLQRIDDTIDILKLFKNKLKTESFISQLDSKTIQNLEEHFTLWDQIIEQSRQAFDKRNKVPTNTQHILAYCLATSSSINYGAGLYLSKLKQLGDFTAKQSGKITKGVTKGILKIFDPRTRDEAIFAGFYGLQCESCSSWRVILKQDDGNNDYCRCCACDHKFNSRTVSKCPFCQFPFYDDVLQDMINYSNKCPNCNAEINLPESMMSY